MLKLISVCLFYLLFHPVHVSMVSMEYVPEEKGYRLTVRMYSDDLLLDMVNTVDVKEEDITDHVYTGPEDIYEKYINKKLRFTINGKEQQAGLFETEKLEIETIMRLFLKHEGDIETVDIINNILTDIYPDQVNLFIYKDTGNEQAYRFTVGYTEEKLKLGETE